MFGLQLSISTIAICTILLIAYTSTASDANQTKTTWIKTLNERFIEETTKETIIQLLQIDGANCLEKRKNFAFQLKTFAEQLSDDKKILVGKQNDSECQCKNVVEPTKPTNSTADLSELTYAGASAINCNENLALTFLNADSKLFLSIDDNLVEIRT